MVQGGYVSPSSQKTLTVSKKNVLDKSRSGTKTSNSNSSNRNSSPPVSSGIDVSLLKKHSYFSILLLKFVNNKYY